MCFKACASWQWYNGIAAKCPVGRTVLAINIDETYISFHQGLKRGCIGVEKYMLPDGARPPAQRASRHELRMGLTHVGIICDTPEIQPLLPQVLIIPDNVLLKRDLVAAKSLMPGPIYILRRPTKWVTIEICCWILRMIQWTLREVRSRYHVVVLMDVLGQHMATEVMDLMSTLSFYAVFVPAKLTWLLQPCDTHCFALFKQKIQLISLRQRAMASGEATVTVLQWLKNVADCIIEVLNGRSWVDSFRQNGYGGSQAFLSAFVRRHIGPSPAIPCVADYPAAAIIRSIFPTNRVQLDIARLTQGCCTPEGLLMLPAPALLALPAPPVAAPNMIFALGSYGGSSHPKPAEPLRPQSKPKAKCKAFSKPKAKPKSLSAVAPLAPAALPGEASSSSAVVPLAAPPA